MKFEVKRKIVLSEEQIEKLRKKKEGDNLSDDAKEVLNQIYLEQQSMYQECLDLIKNSLEELLIEAIDQPKGEVITCNQEKNI